MEMRNKAFTIIELLVIVAVIGVLAAIVIVNITSLKSRAKDAAVRENMSSFFKLASDYLETHGNYGGFCNYQPTIDLFDIVPAYEGKKTKFCQHDSDDWIICAVLNYPEDRTTAWCIDRSGIRKQINAVDCENLGGETKECP